ncbi:uncharacterized protein EI90DRAFT_3145830 [Cantharellus anzutake]|uniref:uncharacterized protein n=1 Tax=Cantharellus anzutake TaxID=1750568 RepID=UPI0019045E7E|nr:uncharacterized protein EI90DRAFT_3145830 [Cantharellus anzutake]KAF8330080.1 hypothetical protein EI90DRAFT_3145830 [Cantharellus anzutake]
MASKHIRIIEEPRMFYESLLRMVRNAKRRILISSLYIGTENQELFQALGDALRNNPRLQVQMQLDLNRSTRLGHGTPSPSTAHSLLPLLSEFPGRVKIHMFRSPKLKGLMAKLVPPRFNEGWGTWHAKIYGVDDDVIMTGANANLSYFHNRQDRYIQIIDQPQLVVYFTSFIDSFARFSYQLVPASSPQVSLSPHSQTSPDGSYALSWPHQSHPTAFESQAGDTLRTLRKQFEPASSNITDPNEDLDTVFYPLVQSGIMGIREEEEALEALFKHLIKDHRGSQVDLTSGYFALYKPYQDHTLKDGVDWRILLQANGFYGSKGLSGRIPDGYTLLEQRFWARVIRARRESNGYHGVELSEWEKNGWTYHAKGIWITPPDFYHPTITLFGSTNLNSRSANLDTELSFLLHTRSSTLQQRLDEEVRWLWKDSRTVGAKEWIEDRRRVPFGTRLLVDFIVGSML